MPSGDRTGPGGLGSMTGRRLGYCAGFSAPGYFSRGYRGIGRGAGGRGRRGMNPFYGQPIATPTVYNPISPIFPQTIDKEMELEILKKEKEYLETSVDNLTKRIEEIEKEK